MLVCYSTPGLGFLDVNIVNIEQSLKSPADVNIVNIAIMPDNVASGFIVE
jgi:hypothetical protein